MRDDIPNLSRYKNRIKTLEKLYWSTAIMSFSKQTSATAHKVEIGGRLVKLEFRASAD